MVSIAPITPVPLDPHPVAEASSPVSDFHSGDVSMTARAGAIPRLGNDGTLDPYMIPPVLSVARLFVSGNPAVTTGDSSVALAAYNLLIGGV